MRNIVCIGASWGGLDSIRRLVRGLPADLPAAVFIVRHITPEGPGLMTQILRAHCALPVADAVDGETIEPGKIYIGPPNRHLLLNRTSVSLVNGPKENWARPAIDPLFRSAAQHHGPRTIGVVLSGKLDDGTAGLWAIKRRGGFAVVQSPSDALASDMPRHALAAVQADAIADAEEIGLMLPKWCREPSHYAVRDLQDKTLEVENAALLQKPEAMQMLKEVGIAPGIVCPDCGGQFWQMKEGPLRFRCHVGHGYSAHTFLSFQGEELESKGWSFVRTLEEDIELADRILQADHPSPVRDLVAARKEQSRAKLDAIRALVLQGVIETDPHPNDEERSVDERSDRPLSLEARRSDQPHPRST